MTRHHVNPGAEALCAFCPSADEVSTFLQFLGFRLAFHMPAVTYAPSSATPSLAAQYHYEDTQGNEIIYLAGRDVDPDVGSLPQHASRWWAFPAADPLRFRQVLGAT